VADFLTCYTNATGAGWIVRRTYVEKVGEEGFKKAPVGAGPYKFVSFTPGVELAEERAPAQAGGHPVAFSLYFPEQWDPKITVARSTRRSPSVIPG